MSHKTIYKCDRCGAEFENTDQLSTITAGRAGYGYSGGQADLQADWCYACCKQIGLAHSWERAAAAREGKTLPPAPSLEILIRELLEHFGVQFQGEE